MWENITIVGRVILFALAGYGAYSIYLQYRAHKKDK